MDEETENYEEPEYEEEADFNSDEEDAPVSVVPPTEGAFGKYLREYRLLNSLLLSLGIIVGIIGFMLAWTIVVHVGEEGDSDFGEAGPPAAQQQQQVQKQMQKLMQRQKKATPSSKSEFKTTTVSEISLPDFNELDVKDLAPVVEAAPPQMTQATMNNESMKSALKGIKMSLPKVMQQRCDPKKRVERLRSGGGRDMTEDAIVKGLNWLKSVQDSDGGWGKQDKDAKGEKYGGYPEHRDAMTAMAILAFLGHCELQDSPEFGETVKRGIDFLTSSPPDKWGSYDKSGKFTGLSGGGRAAYSHAIRSYALCEAYTMTKIPKLKEFAKRAIKLVIDGQNPNGGWAYGYGIGVGAHVDLSVSGWCIQALKAFALTGITDISVDEAMDKAVEYVKKCQDSVGRFQYMIEKHGGGSGHGSLTGTGVLSLQIWKNANSSEAKKGLDWIVENRLHEEWKKVDVYEWYYHAQACFQSTGAGSSKYWREWNKNFQQVVVKAQESDGHWPHGYHFHGDTDLYRTTMTILMLEVYYRYAPMTKV
jgi:prenyltransferase beta subunit